jgi:hypothetical protein
MPKSTVKKKRMFRDMSKLPSKYVKQNHLKNLRTAMNEFLEDNPSLTRGYVYFMLYAYDLEFFTISWAAENYQMSKGNLADRIIYPLMSLGYIYKVFDKLSPSQTLEDHLFRDETKYNYRVRYGLSQKGRLAVQRFYNSL